ncbi:MAG: Asp-tRNA(Asn)/Glu-tRNA(Gln) amidotransferase subunit GatA [Desulfarculales bacterium]|jgi:aspartyl-tRNA(Asn)/glutamyl-tRNA(Gln) amidotransferase subunit A|nr:Asp-tRNA(Asn)/Glu-tRNA(Gln) amidotransferase subunit GatA [Desulfarculales bacterium]
MNLYDLSLSQAAQLLAQKQISSLELTKAVLARQEETEPSLNCYITVTPDLALDQARRADERRAQGKATPLTGIPLSLKDVINTQGIQTTAASRMLQNFTPPYDATVTRRLLAAGAVLTGKTNADEFAMGSTTETSYFGPTRNPWDLKAFPGGSSGGSAASLAAGSCLGSIGTDTGGSIRQPASHCGIVGLKPTYGLISRYGIIAYASSLDQAGPMGRSVADVALLLQILAGFDRKDSTSIPCEIPDYNAALTRQVKGLRLGVPREFFVSGLDEEVQAAVERGLALLAGQGVELVPISLPHTQYFISTYYIIATAEASSNLARYEGVKYGYSAPRQGANLEESYLNTRGQGFGQEVIRRIMLGTYVLSSGYYDAYYAKASQARTLVIEDFHQAFRQVDAIAAPVAPHPALDLGQAGADPLTIYLRDIYTIPCNLTGLPGMSIPAGFSSQGRPIGLQLLAPRLRENTLLSLGAEFQRNSDFHQQRPVSQE